MKQKIAVLGPGSWGTALAQTLAENGHDVRIWGNVPEQIDEINKYHTNQHFLPDLTIPESIIGYKELAEAVDNADAILFVVPTKAIRSVAQELIGKMNTKPIIIHASKGLEQDTHKRISEVLAEEIPEEKRQAIVVLSGPSHAEEVAVHDITTITAASIDQKAAAYVQTWVLAKDEEKKAELNSVMIHLAESLRIAAILLQPIMTETPEKIFNQLGLDSETMNLEGLHFGEFPSGTKVVAKGTPIFPRLDMEEEVAFIQEKMSEGTQTNEDTVKWDPEETELVSTKEKQIKFDVFEKVELKVAEVINCQKVEGADKLLQFRLDAGDSQDRQILSGIAEFYPDPSELIGKKVVIVANLKPRKMRGQISQGMILSAEAPDGSLQVIEAPKSMPNGSEIA
ncbi:methionine--tRNA ligase subunit beta (plasmid) [Enterococcus faecium]|nr:methionine--tRNA ligase subunit beta [Enterococcus faecium]